MATLMHSAAGREKMEVGESEAVRMERWEKLQRAATKVKTMEGE